jgi:hypothetical protein
MCLVSFFIFSKNAKFYPPSSEYKSRNKVDSFFGKKTIGKNLKQVYIKERGVSPDTGVYFRLYKIRLILSVGPLIVCIYKYFNFVVP